MGGMEDKFGHSLELEHTPVHTGERVVVVKEGNDGCGCGTIIIILLLLHIISLLGGC